MQTSLIIILCLVGVVLISIMFILLRKKKEQSPIIARAQEILIKINQKIYAVNHNIDKLDNEISKLIVAKERGELKLFPSVESIEDIPEIVEKKKEKVEQYISDLRDLKQFKENIESQLKARKETELLELEQLLDKISEKLKQMF
ncbi:MAG: hypothetical protein ACTSVB_08615 [Candidatus Heimdallarchaeaceae archaeon]|uniref:Uncharacterized protein n=1 Tax=Candidatus Heimdallarchaeum endolithica TaxID=2876572 RepID=A0A9Y1BPP8_9ARCH|nr:MAG: hypothetical protein K9W46_11160 [Candidatus Heimdallarchaeum endolithica]